MVYFTRRFIYCLILCYFVFVFFSPFSIAITTLREERANLRAFGTFVWFVLVWICRFPLPLGVLEGLRFVVVALPGLFSYLFFTLLTVVRRWSRCWSSLCCFVVYFTRRFVLCLTLCYFVLVFFNPFSIAITSLGEERANLSAFRTFIRFVLVCFCCPPPFRRKAEGHCFWLSVVHGWWRVVRGAWCVARGAWCVARGAWFRILVGTLSL